MIHRIHIDKIYTKLMTHTITEEELSTDYIEYRLILNLYALL